MDHFAGLDVSVKETSVCIVDDVGKIVRAESNRLATDPERNAVSQGRAWCHGSWHSG